MPPELQTPIAILAALLLAFGGFAALANTMNPPMISNAQNRVSPLPWRLSGAALLFMALLVAIGGWGVSVGLVGWTGTLSLAAIAVVFMMAYAPHLGRIVVYGAPLAGALLAAFAFAA